MNNKKKSQTEFAESLDRRLSGLQGDPWLAQRIIANEEGKPVVKKISTSMVLVIAILAVAAAALAAGGYLGWFDFYSNNYGIQVSDTAQRIMNDSRKTEYTVGNVTFTVSETYCDGYTALASTQISLSDSTSALITGDDPYDFIGINTESGSEYAKKLGVTPDTSWVDAAKKLGLPLYIVRTSLTMPEELRIGDDMEGSMTSDDGMITYFCMSPLNGKAYGEIVSGRIELSVWQFNMENPDDQSKIAREEFDIGFMLEAPIDTVEYAVPENTMIGNLFTLESIKGVWMPGGLYFVSSFTAENEATEDQAYELLQAVIPLDGNGEEYRLGLNLTGNILNLNSWPNIEMFRMTTLNEIPETLIVSIPETDAEVSTLSLELMK